MVRGGYIYILTNKNNTVLYTGVTSNLRNRIFQHREKIDRSSFTYRYNVHKLVYYETFGDIEEAIVREKQIKGGSRAKKTALINEINPQWKDLWDEIEELI
jgi:putative endonuclease